MGDVLRPREIAVAGTGGAAIADVAVSADGEAVALCFAQTIVVLSWTAGEELFRMNVESIGEAVAFAPDGSQLAAACADGTLCVFDSLSPRRIATMTSEQGGYSDIAWSPGGALIAGGHYEPFVSLFDVRSGRVAATLDPDIFSDEGRTAVTFSPDGRTLVSTAYNSIVRWSLPASFPLGGTKVKRKTVSLRAYAFLVDAAFAVDGTALAGLAETEGDITLHVWNEGDGRPVHRKMALPNFSQRLTWAADGSFIAVIEQDAPGVSLWNPLALTPSDVPLEGVPMSMAAIAAHPRRAGLVAGSEQGELVIWERTEAHPS